MQRVLSAVGLVLSWLVIIALLLICVGPVLGSSIYLDRNGVIGPGEVITKDEQITPSAKSNSWFRRLTVTVRYQPHDQGSSVTIPLSVDAAGSEVWVRYQPKPWLRQFPFIAARLENQSTLSFLSGMADNGWPPIMLGLVAIVLFVYTIRARSMRRRVVFGGLLLLNIGAIVMFSVRPAVFFDADRPRLRGMARVRDVERITTDPGTPERPSRELLRPIDRVELELDPHGDGGVVVGVDDIDVGSWLELEIGAMVEVSYPTDNPREAQIVGATRQHEVINRLDVPLELGMYVAIIGLVSVLMFGSRMFPRRCRAQRHSGQQPGP
jgi:hypothetical protein